MTWTTDKPTQPGWYWVRNLSSELLPWTPAQLVHITKSEEDQGSFITYVGAYYGDETDEELSEDMDGVSGEWAGPLEPPD